MYTSRSCPRTTDLCGSRINRPRSHYSYLDKIDHISSKKYIPQFQGFNMALSNLCSVVPSNYSADMRVALNCQQSSSTKRLYNYQSPRIRPDRCLSHCNRIEYLQSQIKKQINKSRMERQNPQRYNASNKVSKKMMNMIERKLVLDNKNTNRSSRYTGKCQCQIPIEYDLEASQKNNSVVHVYHNHPNIPMEFDSSRDNNDKTHPVKDSSLQMQSKSSGSYQLQDITNQNNVYSHGNYNNRDFLDPKGIQVKQDVPLYSFTQLPIIQQVKQSKVEILDKKPTTMAIENWVYKKNDGGSQQSTKRNQVYKNQSQDLKHKIKIKIDIPQQIFNQEVVQKRIVTPQQTNKSQKLLSKTMVNSSRVASSQNVYQIASNKSQVSKSIINSQIGQIMHRPQITRRSSSVSQRRVEISQQKLNVDDSQNQNHKQSRSKRRSYLQVYSKKMYLS